MKRVLMLAVVAVLALGPAVMASPFVNPPEDNAPAWFTQFPYQRNLDWDLSTDPMGGPTPNGAPGAHYEGYDDPELMDTDWFEYGGAVHWCLGQLPGLPGVGILAVDNREGTEPVDGWVRIHIDNWDDPRRLKHIWMETDFLLSDPAPFLDLQVTAAGGAQVAGYWASDPVPTAEGLLRQNQWLEIVPNPLWEELTVNVVVDPGQFIVFDRLHIATECVPEPSAMTLLGVGLAMASMMLFRRKC